jgi:hypothetical protein
LCINKLFSLVHHKLNWDAVVLSLAYYSGLDVPSFGSSLMLYGMGCLSFVLALSFYTKLVSLRKLPENLTVSIFSKTFNVFDPFPKSRRAYGGSVISLLVSYLAFCGVAVVMAGILEFGLLLSLLVASVCASVMMLGEAYEIFQNANIFTKAVRKNVSFGKGDFDVLTILRSLLPRLTTYYVLLSVIFFASGAALHYIMPAAVSVFAQVYIGVFEFARTSIGLLAAYLTIFLLVVTVLAAHIVFGKLKNRFLSFPPSASLDHAGKQFEAMKQFVMWHDHELAHRPTPEPEEIHDSERDKS